MEKLTFEPIKPKFYSDLELLSKDTYDLMNQVSQKFNRQFEDEIIKVLNKKGYTFQSQYQLYEFAKRCEIRHYTHKNAKELYFYDELILSWFDDIEMSMGDNNVMSISKRYLY